MAIRLIKIAVVYLVIGLTLGVGMGMTHNFLFRSVHAHVNLIGWASLALAALVFHVFPETARTRLATIWFWTYNVSVPVGLGGLALVMAGQKWAEPALIVGQLGIWAAGLMFAVNIFWALRSKSVEDAPMARSPAAV
ncbi:MAG: cytochrome-c oxidase [Rhizobiales bacterium]|nr:cytochrome-c oxidase [Hyphomicrobiales bacterium]